MSDHSLPAEGSPSSRVTRWGVVLKVLVLVVAVGWTFSPTILGDWQWDDISYVTENATIHDPEGLKKIWLQPGNFIEYYPISASVQWLQWQSWKKLTFGYHFTNIVLHLLSAFLLWRFFLKFGLRFAWLGALLFALHPTTVESVAWISELKNTLSLPPFLLAMGAYMDFDERRQNKDYFLALGLFLVAMLCKMTMMVFPVVILLYAWWKRGRIGWQDVKASAPFFVISLVLGAMGLWAGAAYSQVHGLGSNPPLGDCFSRLACAGLSLSFYFYHFLWPMELMPIYPQWKVEPPTFVQFMPWLVIGGALYGLLSTRVPGRRHVLLGLGFFVLNLAPFLGFKSISYMRFTPVMDHLLYMPQIGLIGLVIAGLGCLDNFILPRLRPYFLSALLAVVALMAARSHAYAEHFLDEETLWTYELQHNPQAWPAYDHLGNAFLRQGMVSKAAELYEQSIRINPESAVARNNLGVAQEQMGDIPAALASYREALTMAPSYLDAQHNLARLQATVVPQK